MKCNFLNLLLGLLIAAAPAFSSQSLDAQIQQKKIVFITATSGIDANSKTVAKTLLADLQAKGFNCLMTESVSILTSLPTGLTFRKAILLSKLGALKSNNGLETPSIADVLIESAQGLNYKLLTAPAITNKSHRDASTAVEIANKVNSKECQRIVVVIPGNSVERALQSSGWDTITLNQ